MDLCQLLPEVPGCDLEQRSARGARFRDDAHRRRGERGGKARGRREQPVDVLGVGWDGREGDPPRRAARGGDGKPRLRISFHSFTTM